MAGGRSNSQFRGRGFFTTRNLIEQGRAGLSGAVDAATLGLADPVSAAFKATFAPRGGGSWGARVQRNLAVERAQDIADAKRYSGARAIGQGVGTVGAILGAEAALPIRAGVALARFAPSAGRLAGNAAHVFKLGATTGAAAGAAGQGVSDLVSHQRPSPKRYLASTAAGALGGVVAPVVGIAKSGAVAGAATPTFQALAEGRMPSISEVSAGASGGAILSHVPGAAAARWAKGLSSNAKGALGEKLTRWTPRRDLIAQKKQRVALSDYSGHSGYMVPDFMTRAGRNLESKFGEAADYTKRQKQAIAEQIDLATEHWLPRDVGAMSGVGVAEPGVTTIFDIHDQLQKRRDPPAR